MKNLRKMFAGVVTSVLMFAGIGFAFSAPAQAAYSDCSNYSGTICMTQYSNWTGQVWRQYPEQVYGCRSLGGTTFNDKASAALSTASGHYQVRLWQHSNCTGNYLTLHSGQARVFTGSLSDIDNMVSGVEVIAL